MAGKRYRVTSSIVVERTDAGADAQSSKFWETTQTWHNMRPTGVTGLQRMLVGLSDQLVSAGEEVAVASEAKDAAAG